MAKDALTMMAEVGEDPTLDRLARRHLAIAGPLTEEQKRDTIAYYRRQRAMYETRKNQRKDAEDEE